MLDDIVKGVNGMGDKRFQICLMERGTGTIVFAIPNTKDQTEKEQVLEDQIYKRLVQFANMFKSYQKAIEEVQGYLRALCNHLPMEKPWIVNVSEKAGQRFLNEVKRRKTMREKIIAGEMFLDVNTINNQQDEKE